MLNCLPFLHHSVHCHQIFSFSSFLQSWQTFKFLIGKHSAFQGLCLRTNWFSKRILNSNCLCYWIITQLLNITAGKTASLFVFLNKLTWQQLVARCLLLLPDKFMWQQMTGHICFCRINLHGNTWQHHDFYCFCWTSLHGNIWCCIPEVQVLSKFHVQCLHKCNPTHSFTTLTDNL